MGTKNLGVQVQEYVYDFSVDGGTNGANIVLSDKNGKAPIPVGAVITGVTALVQDAIVGTSSTFEWGIASDSDGYSGTAIAEASLTANAVFNGWDNAAALLWDDTNDHPIYVPVTNAASGAFVCKINVADLTAGKVVFCVSYLFPAGDN